MEDSKQLLKLGVELLKYNDTTTGGQSLELLLQRIAYWSKKHHEDEKKPITYVFLVTTGSCAPLKKSVVLYK